MDKKQHNSATQDNNRTELANGGRPGQELPANATPEESTQATGNDTIEHHSESGRPAGENETLGTP